MQPFSQTKIDLMAVAEQLFGTDGISAVSMRSISERSGNRNTSAAQYHFGSKANLIRSIVMLRRVELDRFREIFHASLDDAPRLIDRVRVLVRPMIDFRATPDGRHFVRFLNEVIRLGLFDSLRENHVLAAPFTNRILEEIRAMAAPVPDHIWWFRIRVAFSTIVESVARVDRDDQAMPGGDDALEAELVRIVSGVFGG